MSALRDAASKALAALSLSRPTRSDEQSDEHYLAEREAHMEAIKALRAALAEPEQDPVAYLIRGSDAADKLCASVVYQELGSALDCAQAFARRYSTVRTLPLYTHPAPAKQPGYIVVAKNNAGHIVAVTRQDSDGRVIEVIEESTEEKK